jgi:hypothetical protein
MSRWQEGDHSNEDAATTFHCPGTEDRPRWWPITTTAHPVSRLALPARICSRPWPDMTAVLSCRDGSPRPGNWPDARFRRGDLADARRRIAPAMPALAHRTIWGPGWASGGKYRHPPTTQVARPGVVMALGNPAARPADWARAPGGQCRDHDEELAAVRSGVHRVDPPGTGFLGRARCQARLQLSHPPGCQTMAATWAGS